MNKIKAIGWLALFPVFFLMEIILALVEHKWGWKHHWKNVICFWVGGYSTDYEGRVLDEEGNQLWPRIK